MNLSLKKIGDGKIKQILLFLYLAFQSVWNKICKLLNNGKFTVVYRELQCKSELFGVTKKLSGYRK